MSRTTCTGHTVSAAENILDLGGVVTAAATEHVALLFFATVRALQSVTFDIAIVR